MTPEDIKTLKIMFATFKFELCEIISDIVDSYLRERWKDEAARRRERTWS